MDRGTKGAHQSPATRAQRACSISAQTANREQNEARRARASIQVSELTSGMKQRTIQTLYAYWNELRAGRVAPRRLEIEPARIGSILPETFMLERTESRHVPLSVGRHATLRNISSRAAWHQHPRRLGRATSCRPCTPPGFCLRAGRCHSSHHRSQCRHDAARATGGDPAAAHAHQQRHGACDRRHDCDDNAALAWPRAADRQAPHPARADLAGWKAARARGADTGRAILARRPTGPCRWRRTTQLSCPRWRPRQAITWRAHATRLRMISESLREPVPIVGTD